MLLKSDGKRHVSFEKNIFNIKFPHWLDICFTYVFHSINYATCHFTLTSWYSR